MVRGEGAGIVERNLNGYSREGITEQWDPSSSRLSSSAMFCPVARVEDGRPSVVESSRKAEKSAALLSRLNFVRSFGVRRRVPRMVNNGNALFAFIFFCCRASPSPLDEF